jgi:hypothetical protein
VRSMATRPDRQHLLRAGIAVAVWTGLVLLLIGSVWELRSGAAERLASPAQTEYLTVAIYAPLFAQLPPDLSEKLRRGNYTRLFDEARRRVRAWEKVDVK